MERALYEVAEWWNGDGAPQQLREDAIAPAARVAHLAADAVVLDDLGGAELAVDGVRRRSGSILDPTLVETFAANASEVLDRSGDPREMLLEEEPQPVDERELGELPAIAAVFGDVADLKFPSLHGHSSGVATLALGAARCLRLDDRTSTDVQVAAHLHDLGRLAVTNAIWEKPGPLTSAEWEQVRMHAYHSERILATSGTLAHLAPLVGMHHERLDGSGTTAGSAAREQPAAVRVLAAADAFQAMTQDRPHRSRLPAERAADELARDARAGSSTVSVSLPCSKPPDRRDPARTICVLPGSARARSMSYDSSPRVSRIPRSPSSSSSRAGRRSTMSSTSTARSGSEAGPPSRSSPWSTVSSRLASNR